MTFGFGGVTAPGTAGPALSTGTINDEIEALRPLFPAWPDSLLRIYAEAWIETGDPAIAMARVRQSREFADSFPGIVRDDGSLRFNSAQDYLAARTLFDAELLSIGIEPRFFTETFVDLLEAEVSPREMVDRIESAFTAVIDRAPELQAIYAATAGLTDITPQAILASFLDPRVGEEILNRRIGVAEIGSEAAVRNVTVDLDLIERLFEVGVTPDQAAQTFGDAADIIPVINTLARRHNDPDDDFDIEEFVSASIFDDPFQRRRMRRLLAQERALFTTQSPLQTDRTGMVRGLIAR